MAESAALLEALAPDASVGPDERRLSIQTSGRRAALAMAVFAASALVLPMAIRAVSAVGSPSLRAVRPARVQGKESVYATQEDYYAQKAQQDSVYATQRDYTSQEAPVDETYPADTGYTAVDGAAASPYGSQEEAVGVDAGGSYDISAYGAEQAEGYDTQAASDYDTQASSDYGTQASSEDDAQQASYSDGTGADPFGIAGSALAVTTVDPVYAAYQSQGSEVQPVYPPSDGTGTNPTATSEGWGDYDGVSETAGLGGQPFASSAAGDYGSQEAGTYGGQSATGGYNYGGYGGTGSHVVVSTTPAKTTTTPIEAGSLYCFALMQKDGYEAGLLKLLLNKGISLFACDAYTVFSDKVVEISPGPPVRIFTTSIGSMECEYGGKFNLALNTDIFVKAWRKVFDEGEYLKYSWSVKVDPDCVFLPERLREQVKDSDGMSNVYLNNCDQGLHGPIEVLAQGGMETFRKGIDRCLDDERIKGEKDRWGEDVFLRHCLGMLKVNRVDDFRLLSEEACFWENPPKNGCRSGKASFHPFKKSDTYMACYKEAKSHPSKDGHS